MGLSQKPRPERDDPFPHLWEDLEHYASSFDAELLAASGIAIEGPSSSAQPITVEPAAVTDPVADVPTALDPVPVVPQPSPPATPTLGRLLESQGHAGEAEDVYRQVLRQHPSNREAAEKLLEKVRRRPWPLRATDLLAESAGAADGASAVALFSSATPPGAASGTELRRHLLGRYVDRIRRGGR